MTGDRMALLEQIQKSADGDFLRSLARRGLKGVKLVISDAHEGLKAAIAQVLSATWQRRRVHFMRSLLCHVPKDQQSVVSAAVRQVFVQPDRKTAGDVWRHVADQLRPRLRYLTLETMAEGAAAPETKISTLPQAKET